MDKANFICNCLLVLFICLFSLFLIAITAVISIYEYQTIEGKLECIEVRTYKATNIFSHETGLEYLVNLDGNDYILRPENNMKNSECISNTFEIGDYYIFSVYDEWNTYGLIKVTDRFMYIDEIVKIEGECG